jgi:peroxiredoxin
MHAYRDQYAQLFHDGRNVVLVAISVDPADTLAAWARDDEFQYLFASDSGSVIGKAYGAINLKYGLDNRNLFVVGPDGRIAYRAIPFREVDASAYRELGAAVRRAGGQADGRTGGQLN